MHPTYSAWSLFPPLLIALRTTAYSKNVTIDDASNANVHYFPVDNWSFMGPYCPGCNFDLDPAEASSGTWHGTLICDSPSEQRPSISLEFNGSAIYTYFIIPSSASKFPLALNLSVDLDDQHMPAVTQHSDHAGNLMGYFNSSLPPGPHQLNITVSGANGTIVLFDYAEYTFDDSTQAADVHSHSAVPIGVIIGATVGGVLLVITVAMLYYRRCHRQTSSQLSKRCRKRSRKRSHHPIFVTVHKDCFVDRVSSSIREKSNIRGDNSTIFEMSTKETQGEEIDPFSDNSVSQLSRTPVSATFWPSPTIESMYLKREELQRRIIVMRSTIESLVRTSRSISDDEREGPGIKTRIAELRNELGKLRLQEQQLRNVYPDPDDRQISPYGQLDTAFSQYHNSISV